MCQMKSYGQIVLSMELMSKTSGREEITPKTGDTCGSPKMKYFPISLVNKWSRLRLLSGFFIFPNYCFNIISAAFSAIIIVGAFVLPATIVGMMDASATLNPSMP